MSRLGIKDDDIIPLLHRHRRTTFFTQDKGFFKPAFCHTLYCIAYLEVPADDAAHYVRRFLRHAHFNSVAKRMGVVARVHHNSIHFWHSDYDALREIDWYEVA